MQLYMALYQIPVDMHINWNRKLLQNKLQSKTVKRIPNPKFQQKELAVDTGDSQTKAGVIWIMEKVSGKMK